VDGRGGLTWLKCALCMAGVQGLELLPDPILEGIWPGRPAADSSLAKLASWSSIYHRDNGTTEQNRTEHIVRRERETQSAHTHTYAPKHTTQTHTNRKHVQKTMRKCLRVSVLHAHVSPSNAPAALRKYIQHDSHGTQRHRV